LRQDREIVIEAVRQHGDALLFAEVALKQDRQVVIEAVRQHGESLRFADEALRRDREVVLNAVWENGWSLRFADTALRQDREVVFEAVRQHCDAFKFVGNTLRNDPLLQPHAVQCNRLAGLRAQAPIACVSTVSHTPDNSIEIWVTCGLSGSETSFLFNATHTLGNLATEVVRSFGVEGGLVHMVVPGRGRCTPLDATLRLADLRALCTTW